MQRGVMEETPLRSSSVSPSRTILWASRNGAPTWGTPGPSLVLVLRTLYYTTYLLKVLGMRATGSYMNIRQRKPGFPTGRKPGT